MAPQANSIVLVVLTILALSINSLATSPQDTIDDSQSLGVNVPVHGDRITDKIPSFFNSTHNLFSEVLYNVSDYIPISIEYALDVGHNCNIIEYNRDYYGTTSLIIAAVLFVIGVLFCFIGYRLLKVNLFLIGFLVGGSLVYLILLGLDDRFDGGEWKIYVYLAVACVTGVICGIITICIYYVGLFLAGASVGFLLAWFILALINIPYFQQHMYIPLLVAVAVGILCGIVTLIFQKWLVIVGTSVVGGFLISWSIDYYLELGRMIYYLFLFAENRSSLSLCWFSWIVLVGFVVVAIVGLIVQGAVTGRKYNHKEHFKVCCGICSKKEESRSSHTRGYMPLKSLRDD